MEIEEIVIEGWKKQIAICQPIFMSLKLSDFLKNDGKFCRNNSSISKQSIS